MKNEEILERLNKINDSAYSLDEFYNQLLEVKKQYVNDNDQEQAKRIWIYQTIVEIHQNYRNAFKLLQNKSYYQGWYQLERIEIDIGFLKRHFLYDQKQFFLWHIESSVKKLQVIFPYKLFGSSELLKKKKQCSICNKEISIRSHCGHILGEIYNGEMCLRIVTEVEVLGMAIVENPGNKFSVMFLKDEKTGEQIDQYNYDTVEYLFECLESPYEYWDLEISQRVSQRQDFNNTGRNDPCPCGSEKKFKKCCYDIKDEKHLHYEFLLLNPIDKKILTNTVKKMGFK